jgi:hypothetical protein
LSVRGSLLGGGVCQGGSIAGVLPLDRDGLAIYPPDGRSRVASGTDGGVVCLARFLVVSLALELVLGVVLLLNDVLLATTVGFLLGQRLI